jgi:hypothetical protein
MRVDFFPGARVYPPTLPRSVDLLRSEPRRAHEAFAVIRYAPPTGMDRRDVEWRLRERGAAIGADALVIEVDTVYRESVWVGPYRPLRGRVVHRAVVRDRVIEAVAIRYH